ncbi:chemotaxis protein CheA [Corallococcus sp. BB11-1]|uniref:chemotaxis protein CheA n=1 Tax=Corallococcus sp. BB11-1 TaxID=2996783 RepID=UPI00227142D7|nr:chemotaxis protein CheA [Corallococcus sp. BB11-1]MCY1030866.1 chemotaxis protein CheA [Corallococcus sp. BB11-1]
MGDTPGWDDVMREFLLESREHVQSIEATVLELEAQPGSQALLAQLFRSLHTVKGTCGFLGFTRLEGLMHSAEELLGLARDKRFALDRERVSTLLALADAARGALEHIEATGMEPAVDHSALLARLAGAAAAAVPLEAPEAPPIPGVLPWRGSATGVDSKLRVDVALLDRLMNLMGELVLARNRILQCATGPTPGADLATASQRLDVVTTQVQQVVMKTRLQPVGQVWNRFPRLVRELAHGCGKQVRLQLQGADTELDKTLVEALHDPLTHLLRNAVDHGVETPEQRRQRGKPPVGCVTLSASHEGGLVHLGMSDDGAGIDVQRVRQVAVQRGLLTSDQAARLSDADALLLIFMPGFSTAERVTSLSGRGVGMDVVRTQVERIGGTVEVHSRQGQGTTFTLKIPLTLAIIPALLVTCRGDRYALPQASLREVVWLEPAQARRDITRLQDASVLRLRGELLPLVVLASELGVGPAAPDLDGGATLVVLQAGERTFGLWVDAIHDTEEIVVKPLWKHLKGLSCYAGATVLGDGRVALILDAMGLGRRVGAVSEAPTQLVPEAAPPMAPAPEDPRERVLLCRTGAEGRVAIPLSRVARLEELPLTEVEHLSGGMELARYHGQLLPLVRVASVLEGGASATARLSQGLRHAAESSLSVVVTTHADTRVGLVVDAILDVAEVEVALQRETRRAGVLGSMVVLDRATEFLDVEGAVRAIHPELLAGGAP